MNNSECCLSKLKHYLSCCSSRKHKGVVKAVCECCNGKQTLVVAYDEKSEDGSSTDIEISEETVKIS